jgi:hypothetical protein
MRTSVWCSAHTPTEQQVQELTNNFKSALVFLKNLSPELQERLNNTPSEKEELVKLAHDVYNLMAHHCVDYIVQPGGSPAFQFVLGDIREKRGLGPQMLYAHSERVSIDQHQEDGSIVKTSVFKHVKFLNI